MSLYLKNYNNITVLRDDTLVGGTKSILMPHLIGKAQEYVYASPVFGGFQIALSAYCQTVGKQATIFCAQRKVMHTNTSTCAGYGANIVQVPHGYLSVVEKAAREYCEESGATKLVFGAHSQINIDTLANRMRAVTEQLGWEPHHIWCAIGSGTLVEGILAGTDTAQVNGVIVGANYVSDHPRLSLHVYAKRFEQRSLVETPFPSMPNYDRKAWEMIQARPKTLFWNVL